MNGRGIGLWLVAGVLGSLMTVQGAAVMFEWDPISSPEVAGYKLSYGPANTEQYMAVVDVGLVTRYTLNGLSEGNEYVFAVQAYAADGRTSEFSNVVRHRVPGEPQPSFPVVVAVDSEETARGTDAGRNALDGNPATMWHTAWDPQERVPQHPHSIILDLGTARTVYGVRYLPRQDGKLNGTIVSYEVYVSLDGATWDSPWLTGSWAPTADEKILVRGSGRRGRYVKFVATSEARGDHGPARPRSNSSSAFHRQHGRTEAMGPPNASTSSGSLPMRRS